MGRDGDGLMGLSQFRSELAKIPELTEADARRMVAKLKRELRRAPKVKREAPADPGPPDVLVVARGDLRPIIQSVVTHITMRRMD